MNKKIFSIVGIVLALLTVFLISITYLSHKQQDYININPVQVEETDNGNTYPYAIATSSLKGYFDVTKAKVGDKVAGMKITSIKPHSSYDVISYYNASVEFSGTTTVKGTYHYYNEDEGFVFGRVCMDNLDLASLSNIPSVYPSTRAWFCFSNTQFAQSQFGPQGSTGNATVVIDNFRSNKAETEIWDTAELVQVLEK